MSIEWGDSVAQSLPKSPASKARLQRSVGAAKITFKQRDGKTVLDDLYQQGSAKVRFARAEPNRITEAVLINTSGGMTGGDCFDVNIGWGQNSTAIVTTQAAERHYKSLGDVATIKNNLTVAANACGLWLPQESIMFDDAAYQRDTMIELAENSKLLAIESSIFGRKAMGEIINNGHVTEKWQIKRGGKLIFADAFGIDGDVAAQLNKPAIGNGNTAISTIIYVGDDVQQIRDQINTLIADDNALGRATCFDGMLVIRLFAQDSQKLRQTSMKILNKTLVKLTKNSDNKSLLPRVWMM